MRKKQPALLKFTELILRDEDEAMETETDSEPEKTVSETVIPKRRKKNENHC